jgi:hypothetical protein
MLPLAMLYHNNANAEISYDFSGFGTLGYAVSNTPSPYLQYIDNKGTFSKDSLIAGQLDIKFSPRLSATIQAKVAANNSQETGVEADITWAFLSYRPSNDWLFRIGELQVPGYLNSVNRDVGVTYNYARLPAETDSTSPIYHFTGAVISKTFNFDDSDFTVDLYTGKKTTDLRYYIGNDIAGAYNQGNSYNQVDIDLVGMSFSYNTPKHTFLAAMHRVKVKNQGGEEWLKEFGFTEIIPDSDIGYYNNDPSSGASVTNRFDLYIANIGADISLGNDLRLASELVYRETNDLNIGINGILGYVSLQKKIDKWTPYIFYSQIKTFNNDLKKHQRIDSNQIPSGIPNAGLINASQHVMADIYQAYDQFSIAIGTSYRFSPVSVIKAEIMFIEVDDSSSLFDVSSQYESNDYSTTIFSLSYSFAF